MGVKETKELLHAHGSDDAFIDDIVEEINCGRVILTGRLVVTDADYVPPF